MKHAERIKIAKEVTKILVKKHGKNIVYVGLYGSTARNEDRKHSDVELVILTKTKHGLEFWPYRDSLIFLEYMKLGDFRKVLKKVGMFWPVDVCQIMASKPMYDKKVLESFQSDFRQIPNKKFTNTAKRNLVWGIEYIGKIKNAYEAQDLAEIRAAILYNFIFGMNCFVALLNRKYFERGDVRVLEDIAKMKRQPKNYAKLAKILWLSNDIDELYETAMQLWKNCVSFASENGIEIKRYKSLEEIEF